MYGYVRPVKGELKISEYERYRGVYCGLCHELRRRYGPLCRFLVNYDFTFLAMLLAGREEVRTCPRRCPAHPFRKTECLCSGGSLSAAADETVILGWWKLADGGRDSGFPKSLAYRLTCRVLKRHYRKAAARMPAFAEAVERNLRELGALEAARCESLDAVADKFALVLRAVADGEADLTRQRVLGELLYHLGRIVYILDAADDLAEDVKTDSYNPLCYRFRPEEGKLSEEEQTVLRTSMQHSHNALSAALSLMEKNPYSSIIGNIVYLGLPAVTQAVFAGTWKAPAGIHRERRTL